MCLWRAAAPIIGMLACLTGAPAHGETVVLAAGERPPYLGKDLPGQGYIAEVARAAFAQAGAQSRLAFSTWTRARVLASTGGAQCVALQEDEQAPVGTMITDRFPGGSLGLLKRRPNAVPANAKVAQAAGMDGELALIDALARGGVAVARMDRYAASDLIVNARPDLVGALDWLPGPPIPSGFRLACASKYVVDIFNAGLSRLRRNGELTEIMHRHGLFAPVADVAGRVRLVIGTVNNGDMVFMRGMGALFEQQHPGVQLEWRFLEENTLRTRLLGSQATGDAQFDLMTIGPYELSTWAQRGWLQPFDKLPRDYDLDDLLPALRKFLTVGEQLYALPFYAESALTYYRKDLLAKAGMVMPAHPSYGDIAAMAARLHDPQSGVYGACLRGLPGWGENMALVGSMVHAANGRWLGRDGQPDLASPAWKAAVAQYVDVLTRYGPPHPERNGFSENLALFSQGHCALWVDASVAAGTLFDPKRSRVAARVGIAPAPASAMDTGSGWLWSWSLAVPTASRHPAEAARFAAWATSREYVQAIAQRHGWIAVPPGTRKSTLTDSRYLAAAPFAPAVREAIEAAGHADPAARTDIGLQYVPIPSFHAIGDRTGLEIARILRREQDVPTALGRAQNFARQQMQGATN